MKESASRDWADEGVRPYASCLRQIEQQDFSFFAGFDRQFLFFAYGRAVSLVHLLAVQFHFSFGDLQPCMTFGSERLRDFLSGPGAGITIFSRIPL